MSMLTKVCKESCDPAKANFMRRDQKEPCSHRQQHHKWSLVHLLELCL